MNKETIFGTAFWGAIIVGSLWMLGVFGDGSTKTQSYQKSAPVYVTPASKVDIPSFDTYGDSADEIPSDQTFHGNLCTVDCSGHEAGYEWAESHGITDPDDCGGKSESFIEGCQSYAEENGE